MRRGKGVVEASMKCRQAIRSDGLSSFLHSHFCILNCLRRWLRRSQFRISFAVLKFPLWIICAASLLSPSSLPAQEPPQSSTIGTHFLIPIPDTVDNKNGSTLISLDPRIELLLIAPIGAEVTLTGPTGIVRTVSVAYGETEIVSAYDLYPPGIPIPIDPPGLRDPRLIDVRSDAPIWTLVRLVTPFGSETFHPLPVERWGQEYRIASLRDWFVQSVGVDPGTMEEGFEFKYVYPFGIVVASEDGTEITLDPALPTTGPRRFMLDAGEAYSIPITPKGSSTDTASRDLSGMLVTASNPVALISGNSRSPGAAPIEDLTLLPGNSLQNLLAEWLPPVSAHGTRFVYTPVNTAVDGAPEIVRIIPSTPGMTTVQTSAGGPPITVDAGSWVEMQVPGPEGGVPAEPIVIESDQPVQVILITGARGVHIPNPDAGEGYGTLQSWSPGMTLLKPVSDWGDVAFAYGFAAPASVIQSAVIVAEEGTLLSIDGRPVRLDPVPGRPFVHGRVELPPGEHRLRSIGGRFSAIGYGIRSGSEEFSVPGTEEGGDGKERMPQHVAVYREYMSLAWASPLPGGVMPGVEPPDSVDITRLEFCDSIVVTILRISDDPSREGPLDVRLEDGLNARIVVDTIAPDGPLTGFRVTLLPIDPDADASGSIVVRGVGLERAIDYARDRRGLLLPDEIDFGSGIVVGAEERIPLTMQNRRPFGVTVHDVHVLTDPGPFGVDDRGLLPRTLPEDGTFTLDITFTGTEKLRGYDDTLVIVTDCGEYRVPLRGETSNDIVERPLPTITGYDWGIRPIGSISDTLSFAANAGEGSYAIADVAIASSPATSPTPFSLIPPLHASESVDTDDTVRLGIRFAPQGSGVWVDTIVLVTTDGDSARALLRGVAIDTSERFEFTVDPIDLDSICIGDTLLVRLTLRNAGSTPVPIAEVTPIRSTNVEYLDVSWPDGQILSADGELTIVIRIISADPGPFELLLGITPSGATEGEVVRITGVARPCAPPELVVTDHDFGEAWITTSRPGSVWVRNVGRGDVRIDDAAIRADAEGSFEYLDPPVPFVLAEGDSVEVFLRFTPATVGVKSADVLFTTSIGERVSNLVGRGKKLVVPAFIRRDYRAAPGTEVFIDIEIERPSDTVFPDRIAYTLRFADELLDALGAVDSSGVEFPSIDFGEISGVRHLDPADSLQEGRLVALRFLVRLSLLRETELPFEIESPLPWLEFEERPGLFVREEICALENRLFEFTHFGVEIGFPEPNPSDDEASFTFEIPFDGVTTIVLYDLLGNEVLRPLDEFISAGRYTIALPTAQLAAGTYILRFRSGGIEGARRVVVGH